MKGAGQGMNGRKGRRLVLPWCLCNQGRSSRQPMQERYGPIGVGPETECTNAGKM